MDLQMSPLLFHPCHCFNVASLSLWSGFRCHICAHANRAIPRVTWFDQEAYIFPYTFPDTLTNIQLQSHNRSVAEGTSSSYTQYIKTMALSLLVVPQFVPSLSSISC
jgi:hypothetical protein